MIETSTTTTAAEKLIGETGRRTRGPILAGNRSGNAYGFVAMVMTACAVFASALRAEPIPVPNGSFELPATSFADPRIESWQKSPKPAWFEENESQQWYQLTGVFLNTAPGAADHIDNLDGNQGLFLFALPEAAVFQDYNSIGGTNSTPSHEFDATFEAGKSYQLTVGVIGGGGNMLEGASLRAALYYLDAASNVVLLAETNIVHSKATFPTNTHFVDFAVNVPTVKADDPWVGQHIGIQLLSTVAPNLVGGYWDLDNLRLTSAGGIALLNPMLAAGNFSLTLQSEPNRVFEILASDSVTASATNWMTLGTVTNVTGTVTFTEPVQAEQRFYRARQAP